MSKRIIPLDKLLPDLYKKLVIIRRSMNKSQKHLLGADINNIVLDILSYTLDAKYDEKLRLSHLINSKLLMHKLSTIIKIAHDLKEITDKDYLSIFDMVDCISIQLNKWYNKVSADGNTNLSEFNVKQ